MSTNPTQAAHVNPFEPVAIDQVLAFHKMMNDNAALCLKLQAGRSSAAFALSVDPVLGVDIHFSAEVLAQMAQDMAPGLQRFAKEMETVLQRTSLATAKPKSPKKKTAAPKASKNAKTKKK